MHSKTSARAWIRLWCWPALGALALSVAAPAQAEPVPARAHVATTTRAAKSAQRSASRALQSLKKALARTPVDELGLAQLASQVLPLTPLRDDAASEAERLRAEQFLAVVAGQAGLAVLAPYVAEAHALRGDYAQVISTLGASHAPPSAAELSALLSTASIAEASDRPDLAEQVLRVGLARAPTSPPLLGALGLTLLVQGKVGDALPLLAQRRDLERMAERAQSGGPGRTFAGVADLAYALMANGTPEEAQALLDAECSTRPMACAALRVRAALESEQVREALELADDALARARDDVGMLYLQAEAATRLGDITRARAAYARILERAPGEQRAQQGLDSLPPPATLERP